MTEDDYVLNPQVDKIKDPFIRELCEYMESKQVVDALEAWCAEHCQEFVPTQGMQGRIQEHSLKNTPLFDKYLGHLDTKMEGFCKDKQLTNEEVFKRCKSALGEDQHAAHFLKMVLGAAEYVYFSTLMSEMKEALEEMAREEAQQ
eukprot:CAMPEP_0197847374 /NCGR_PEP_ID=MMETSP1438-20131217/5831_1 /TAXON_ID=1461541 /ORGANISM="Pterosperma sp., Strain CCMP1384" /LENGTH=144 /DNA_ID=CAMNT_0043459269 /DNA_START=65 /DNA_END=502 /DNA_ORIENTATION=+